MCEFKVENFRIGENYAIEASAGTGKTYNIVKIIEKILRDTAGNPEESRIRLKDILIVTYTEKAAGELKDRIRKAVPKEDVDGAGIGTIHSFCQNTIGEFCLSAGKPSDLALIDEGECREFIKSYIRKGKIHQDICDYKKISVTDDIEQKLSKRLTALLEQYYLDENGNEVSSIVSLSDRGFDVDFWRRYLVLGEPIQAIFPEIQKDIDILKTGPKAVRVDIGETLQAFIDNQTDIKNFKKRTIDKKAAPEQKEAFGRILEIREKRNNFPKNSKEFAPGIAVRYIKDLYMQWQAEKEKNACQTFNDMLRNVREEVLREGSPLLAALRKKYKVAIIDEFQDTNQKQWDIFREVFLNEDHTIIVVGDPKQSIYSFQGADVTVYQNAVAEIAGSTAKPGHKEMLKTNYRASGAMIECNNSFFGTKEYQKEPIFSTFQPSGTGKTGLKARITGEADPVKAFWVFEKGLEDDAAYAASVCEKIIDCCTVLEDGSTKLRVTEEVDGEKDRYEERNVSFRDFAILCRTNKEMVPFMKALEKSGIPYIRYKDNTLFNGKECADWIAVLDAIAAPDFTGGNRKKLRKALFTSFFGYSLAEIRSSKYDRDNVDEIRKFDRWKLLAAEEKWETLIESVIDDSGLDAKMSSLRDLKSLGTLKQIGDSCIEYLSGGRSLEALVTHLRNQAQNEGDDDTAEDNGMIAKSTDFDCVKIMTIHASKGLEFPVVISGAGFRHLKSSADVYGCHINGRYIISLHKPEDDPYEVERYGEFHRLIYVAYTRAKYILMLPGCELSEVTAEEENARVFNKDFIPDSLRQFCRKFPALWENVPEANVDFYDLNRRAGEILERNRTQQAADTGITENEQKEHLLKLRNSIFFHLSWSHSYSSLSSGVKKSGTEDYDDGNSGADVTGFDPDARQILCSYRSEEPQLLSADFPRGTGIGLALHRVFELIDYRASDPVTDELIADCLKEQCLHYKKDGWIKDIREMVQRVLGAVLPVICGSSGTEETMCLKELALEDRKNETRFDFNKEGERLHQYFNGAIDLIFRKDGRYAVLDWKSNALKENFTSFCDGAVLKKEVDREYSIQRVLYAYTLIRWLKQFYQESEEDIFNKRFGGVYYVFLRGCSEGTGNGIYAQTWGSWNELKKAYDAIVSQKVRG